MIGPLRSDDHGRSFHEFVPWHKVTQILEKKDQGSPEFIEIRKISFLDSTGKAFSYQVDTGKKLVNIATMDNGKNWKVVGDNKK